jgi:hypothetical protein
MADDHLYSDLKEAREIARRDLELLDPTWIASRSGCTYSYPEGSLFVPFFGETYRVKPDTGEVLRQDGSTAGAREALVVLHYLINADAAAVREEWVAYRDLPGARTHEPAFISDVERPLSQGLSGRLEELQAWSQRHGRPVDIPGDIAAVWDALPHLPLLVIFNERDEEFPASARVLFDITAADYLPTEDLSVLAEIAAMRILEEVGALA